ncbi:MAG TPA: PDZ domain-containing protein [Nevskiales bacterium]|nr:PDZ domain-containing protein [Nevskiales bacterium]
MESIQYRITPSRPQAHVFTVSCRVAHPDPAGQVFTLPAWTPGSYLIRDFARQVLRFEARSPDGTVAVRKLDKSSWRCAPCAGPLTVEYDVYGWDDSVRAAWLDGTRGFFNGSAVFVQPRGHERLAVALDLEPPQGVDAAHWRVATTLRPAGAEPWGFGRYAADDYADLIDHPVELGEFEVVEFAAGGVPHQLVLSGRHRADTQCLAADLARICTQQIELFGAPPPMARYLFLVRVVKKGYGGLEHRDSTALICAREDLPVRGENKMTRGYRSFLGLCSHEYFHLWNVKRIQPQVFATADLAHEVYTEDLWAYEGVTSYYDELTLVRAGLIDLAGYCEMLAEAATRLWRTPGRRRQSLAESSFDAWTKFYRPDENTPNAVLSYYNKGALVALCLDLKLRLDSGGRCDLDQVMRALWQRYGQPGVPVPERGLEAMAQECSGLDLRDFFACLVRGTEDPPLAELLSAFGIEAQLCQAPGGGAYLGLRLAPGGTQVQHVLDGTPAQAAGLSAGDVLVAFDGLRVEGQELDRLLAASVPGARVRVHAFRRDELMDFEVVLGERPADTWLLRPCADPDAETLARRRSWLRQ